MSRIDAALLLLEALKESNPEDFHAFRSALLASLGFEDIQDAFDDLGGPRHGMH